MFLLEEGPSDSAVSLAFSSGNSSSLNWKRLEEEVWSKRARDSRVLCSSGFISSLQTTAKRQNHKEHVCRIRNQVGPNFMSAFSKRLLIAQFQQRLMSCKILHHE
jgi:hypothetical protein